MDHNMKISVKPRLLEGKVGLQEKFFSMTDGFKKVFACDSKDQKMVIPVVGYGGHRRGDRSQNLFGKNFRETTLQSKCIEREFRSTQRS
jgi:hypothetical protein